MQQSRMGRDTRLADIRQRGKIIAFEIGGKGLSSRDQSCGCDIVHIILGAERAVLGLESNGRIGARSRSEPEKMERRSRMQRNALRNTG